MDFVSFFFIFQWYSITVWELGRALLILTGIRTQVTPIATGRPLAGVACPTVAH